MNAATAKIISRIPVRSRYIWCNVTPSVPSIKATIRTTSQRFMGFYFLRTPLAFPVLNSRKEL
jgi:hypothetical protein